MNIAIITGASSGLGKEFVFAVNKRYPELDEIWIIARRENRLNEIATDITKCRVIAMDITLPENLAALNKKLEQCNANVKLLINNAGFGRLESFKNISLEDNCAMVRLNCEAFTGLAAAVLPFIKSGGNIINICSIAAFTPNARMAVYSSTKAYVMSFSRALRFELRKDNIGVTAICPGPMDTEFLPVANIEKGTSKTFDMLPRVNPQILAAKSLKAAEKHRAVYTCKLFYKFYRLVSKILPHAVTLYFAEA